MPITVIVPRPASRNRRRSDGQRIASDTCSSTAAGHTEGGANIGSVRAEARRRSRTGEPSQAERDSLHRIDPERHLILMLGRSVPRGQQQQVQRLKIALAERAPKTVNNVLTVLSTLRKRAVEWGELQRPIKLLPDPKKTMGFHDFDQYQRLLTVARNRDAHVTDGAGVSPGGVSARAAGSLGSDFLAMPRRSVENRQVRKRNAAEQHAARTVSCRSLGRCTSVSQWWPISSWVMDVPSRW